MRQCHELGLQAAFCQAIFAGWLTSEHICITVYNKNELSASHATNTYLQSKYTKWKLDKTWFNLSNANLSSCSSLAIAWHSWVSCTAVIRTMKHLKVFSVVSSNMIKPLHSDYHRWIEICILHCSANLMWKISWSSFHLRMMQIVWKTRSWLAIHF